MGVTCLVWPLLSALIVWILKFTLPAGKLSLTKLCLISAVCAAPGIILISPLIYQTFVAVGISQTSFVVVPVTLLLGLLLINFELMASSFRWLLPAASTLAAVCFIVAALLQPDFSQQQPKSNEIFYALNADTGKAVWATGDARPDEWTSQFLSSDAAAAPLNDYLPWLNEGSLFTTARSGCNPGRAGDQGPGRSGSRANKTHTHARQLSSRGCDALDLFRH